MKFYVISDVHVDYKENLLWLESIDSAAYNEDVLILAGDVTDDLNLLARVLDGLSEKFKDVMFVPGNHELWIGDDDTGNSIDKFHQILELCERSGIKTGVTRFDNVSVVPLFSWYDFSFGEPQRHLLRAWRDFRSCSWPAQLDSQENVSAHFLAMNEARLDVTNECVISFSHFLPSLDLMPAQIPEKRRIVYPVLGSDALGDQVTQLAPDIHVYGHSHVNRDIAMGNTRYINNAFAYPAEERISRKQLLCVLDREVDLV